MKITNINTDLKRLTALTWFFLSACAADPSQPQKAPLEPTEANAGWSQCPDQRPDICPQHYDPVCGYAVKPEGADSGPEGQSKTYSNGCSACANTKVRGYTPGACPET